MFYTEKIGEPNTENEWEKVANALGDRTDQVGDKFVNCTARELDLFVEL